MRRSGTRRRQPIQGNFAGAIDALRGVPWRLGGFGLQTVIQTCQSPTGTPDSAPVLMVSLQHGQGIQCLALARSKVPNTCCIENAVLCSSIMFRNPRENASVPADETLLPSLGRPPTPPLNSSTSRSQSSPYFASNVTTASPVPSPLFARQTGPRLNVAKKNNSRQNQSILNFFGRADKVLPILDQSKAEADLFFQESIKTPKQKLPYTAVIPDDEHARYNEADTSVKRRRISDDVEDCEIRTPSPEPVLVSGNHQSSPQLEHVQVQVKQTISSTKSHQRRGGFLDDSSDEEVENGSSDDPTLSSRSIPFNGENISISESRGAGHWSSENIAGESRPHGSQTQMESPEIMSERTLSVDRLHHNRVPEDQAPIIPTLLREPTSIFDPGDFDDGDDFQGDEFSEGGEEYMERRWMEEQREMGLEFDEDSKSESGYDSASTPKDDCAPEVAEDGSRSVRVLDCPICQGNLKGLSEAEVSAHVNACLDGTIEPLPKPEGPQTESMVTDAHPTRDGGSKETNYAGPPFKRFQRAAVARPGQADPLSLTLDSRSRGSAFSRLMSGHAENSAWAEAAANELQSRGKPAYQRTCPFYKILPGFNICVDAFRYGKVEGQNAYFLSHFHSDHYIGLTSSWCHGPIYGSKVTINLCAQQLRVDPKWLVPLAFEVKTEVPNTTGVFVTMIPANHCPGSSIFMFEKFVGKNRDGSPKLTRVLHCGDFRACPAHVNHPLLRPDVVDAISGQARCQVIDTCYLDTTYLTPKYSFPGQYDVIDACAQMCVSLSREIVDANDSWEKIKAERAGSAMTKFLEQGEGAHQQEDDDEEKQKQKLRGRLLVVIGTYSIGKERICLGIAKALDSKIYAPPSKMRICACLEDPELTARLTPNPLEAQVHMQTLMEIRAETLHDYLRGYKGHFTRVVGFRPTGWNYRPPTSRFTENPAVATVLHSDGWKSKFTMRDLVPQRGSTRESNCFGVPYSEHSSFRELTMFCCALRIGRIIPTVNVGSARSREKMKAWMEKWELEKKKNGLFKVEAGAEGWGSGDGTLQYGV